MDGADVALDEDVDAAVPGLGCDPLDTDSGDAAGLEVGECEGCELGAAQGAGEAEQQDGGVAGAAHGGAVDGGDDLAQLGDAERSGRAAGGVADDPTQATADLTDRIVVDRVRDSR